MADRKLYVTSENNIFKIIGKAHGLRGADVLYQTTGRRDTAIGKAIDQILANNAEQTHEDFVVKVVYKNPDTCEVAMEPAVSQVHPVSKFTQPISFDRSKEDEKQIYLLTDMFRQSIETAENLKNENTDCLQFVQGRNEIENTIREISAALLGRNVHFI
jgi:hypothetical protein